MGEAGRESGPRPRHLAYKPGFVLGAFTERQAARGGEGNQQGRDRAERTLPALQSLWVMLKWSVSAGPGAHEPDSQLKQQPSAPAAALLEHLLGGPQQRYQETRSFCASSALSASHFRFEHHCH